MGVRFPPPALHPIYKEPIWKVYGPYKYDPLRVYRPFVIAYDKELDYRKTIRYDKFWLECLLWRMLESHEEFYPKDEYTLRVEDYIIVDKRGFTMKCPKCGEQRQIEVVGKSETKIEIYCNTCGKSSVIDYQIPSSTSEV